MAGKPQARSGAIPMGGARRSSILPRMYKELASRLDDGILVRLFWDVPRDQAIVRYRDRRTGDSFTTRVPKSHALEAFRHPNAYRPAFAVAA